MILGIGIDITDIKKIEERIRSEAFQRKVFTSAELDAVERYRNQAEHLAGKFAAKEAFLKALGAGIWQGALVSADRSLEQRKWKILH